MGAEYWEHVSPRGGTAEEALRQVQLRFFRESGYDLSRILDEHICDVAEAVQLCERDDPYDLLDFYRAGLQLLRQMAARGIPEDEFRQIDLLRKIHAVGGDRVGNILDMTGVADDERQEKEVRRLSSVEVRELFGSAIPPVGYAREILEGRCDEIIGRGRAICFPVDDEAGGGAAWFFVGYTAD